MVLARSLAFGALSASAILALPHQERRGKHHHGLTLTVTHTVFQMMPPTATNYPLEAFASEDQDVPTYPSTRPSKKPDVVLDDNGITQLTGPWDGDSYLPEPIPIPTPTVRVVTLQPTVTVFSTVVIATTAPPVIVYVSDNAPISTVTQSAAPTPLPTPAAPTPNRNAPIMAAYYPDWVYETLAPEQVDFKRFDWIDFAFAIPNASFNLTFEQDNSEDLLRRITQLAHASGKRVKLSVGGAGGSKYFSPAVATDESRKTFIDNIVSTYANFGIDGIDLDWEYPGQPQPNADNIISHDDTANYLVFVQALRAALPPSAYITAAVPMTPFASPSGEPSKDVSGFAAVFDWILLMAYDTWGASSTAPGPNAPLSNACGNSTQPEGSATAAVEQWSAAGFPKDKIVLGAPSYGYLQNTQMDHLIQRRGASTSSGRVHTRHFSFQQDDGSNSTMLQFAQDSTSGDDDDDDDDGSTNAIELSIGDNDHQIQFSELISRGVLTRSTSSSPPSSPPSSSSSGETQAGATSIWTASGGFNRIWDTCSSTPYLYSPSTHQLVTYDDPYSLGLKAAFAKQAGLRGVNIFDIHGDTKDWVLVDALRRGLGLEDLSGTMGRVGS